MKRGIYIKQFLAGFFIPALTLIVLLVILSLFGFEKFFTSWDLLFSPVVLGLYNIFYFKIKNKYPAKNPRVRYGIHGLIFFMVVALVYTAIDFGFSIHPEQAELLGPTLNFWWHITPSLYFPLLAYLMFAYLQKPINDILGLKV